MALSLQDRSGVCRLHQAKLFSFSLPWFNEPFILEYPLDELLYQLFSMGKCEVHAWDLQIRTGGRLFPAITAGRRQWRGYGRWSGVTILSDDGSSCGRLTIKSDVRNPCTVRQDSQSPRVRFWIEFISMRKHEKSDLSPESSGIRQPSLQLLVSLFL